MMIDYLIRVILEQIIILNKVFLLIIYVNFFENY